MLSCDQGMKKELSYHFHVVDEQ